MLLLSIYALFLGLGLKLVLFSQNSTHLASLTQLFLQIQTSYPSSPIFQSEFPEKDDRNFVLSTVQKAFLLGLSYKKQALSLWHLASEVSLRQKAEQTFYYAYSLRLFLFIVFSLVVRIFLFQLFISPTLPEEIFWVDITLVILSLIVLVASLRLIKARYPKHWFFADGKLSSEGKDYIKALLLSQRTPSYGEQESGESLRTYKVKKHHLEHREKKTALHNEVNAFYSFFALIEFFHLGFAASLLLAMPAFLTLSRLL